MQTLQKAKASRLPGKSGRAGWLIWVKRRGLILREGLEVPAGVSQRFSKVGSLAKNPSSSLRF